MQNSLPTSLALLTSLPTGRRKCRTKRVIELFPPISVEQN